MKAESPEEKEVSCKGSHVSIEGKTVFDLLLKTMEKLDMSEVLE